MLILIEFNRILSNQKLVELADIGGMPTPKLGFGKPQLLSNIGASRHILEEEGYEILSAYGSDTAKSILATSEDGCINAAKKIGYPVVMRRSRVIALLIPYPTSRNILD